MSFASLDGRTTIVTGAGGGIGRATSLELARAGAVLALVDVDENHLSQTVDLLSDHRFTALPIVADVSTPAGVDNYVASALSLDGRIDAFFNNAGIEGTVAPLTGQPEDAFDRVIAVNLKGVFLGMRKVLAVMSSQRSGSVVNTASMAAHIGLPGTSPYNASKAGVAALTRTAASEVVHAGVRVNAVLPGLITTRMTDSLAQSIGPDADVARDGMLKSTPMGRFGEPHEIATVVRFLLSDEASFVTGICLEADGGAINLRSPAA